MPRTVDSSRRAQTCENSYRIDARDFLRRRSCGSVRSMGRINYSDGASVQVKTRAVNDAVALWLAFEIEPLTWRPVASERDGQRVEVAASEQHLGAVRYWFICSECRQRRRVLFMPRGAQTFACRRCYNLVYRSAQIAKTKQEKLEQQMGLEMERAVEAQIRAPKRRRNRSSLLGRAF
jgi:hypothetical protein